MISSRASVVLRVGSVVALVVPVLPLVMSDVTAARYTTTSRLNLRADSLRTSPVLKVLASGATLESRDEHSDFTGMYYVSEPGRRSGWVAGEYLLTAPSEPPGALASNASFCPKSVARGPVKDLEDQDAGDIATIPRAATISQLRALVRPAKRPADARANQAERTVYRVSGRIIKWGKEKDGDYHLVLASSTSLSSTIVLEIPNPSCLEGTRADLKPLIKKARTEAEAKLGPAPSSIKELATPVAVTVEGVGFFDFGHSTGHPPNAFELHPVLRLKFH